jgi:FMN phosphatase YigB (HAD superfamily)
MATNRMEDDGKTKTLILWDIGTFVMSENPLYLSDLKTVTRKFFPGIIDLFQQFHDQCRMVIISTYLSKDEVNSLLQFNQIQQYFYDVYCSDDHLSDEEENLNIFEFILKKGQIQKADCIYITNSGNSVYEITKEMGIYSIGVEWELATSEALQGLFSISKSFAPLIHLRSHT